MEGIPKKKLVIAVGLVIGFVGIVVLISVFMMNFRQERFRVVIENVGRCSEGISEFSRDYLFSGVYSLVQAQNEIEGAETKDSYRAVFREETCDTELFESDGLISYVTNAVIDISEAGYSFEIGYNWLKNGMEEDGIDLGSLDVTCLESEALLYGEFNCEANPAVVLNKENDPISGILPYFGENFIIMLGADKDIDGVMRGTIVIEYDPPEDVYERGEVQEFRRSRRPMAIDYLTGQGVNLDNYVVEETYAIVR